MVSAKVQAGEVTYKMLPLKKQRPKKVLEYFYKSILGIPIGTEAAIFFASVALVTSFFPDCNTAEKVHESIVNLETEYEMSFLDIANRTAASGVEKFCRYTATMNEQLEAGQSFATSILDRSTIFLSGDASGFSSCVAGLQLYDVVLESFTATLKIFGTSDKIPPDNVSLPQLTGFRRAVQVAEEYCHFVTSVITDSGTSLDLEIDSGTHFIRNFVTFVTTFQDDSADSELAGVNLIRNYFSSISTHDPSCSLLVDPKDKNFLLSHWASQDAFTHRIRNSTKLRELFVDFDRALANDKSCEKEKKINLGLILTIIFNSAAFLLYLAVFACVHIFSGSRLSGHCCTTPEKPESDSESGSGSGSGSEPGSESESESESDVFCRELGILDEVEDQNQEASGVLFKPGESSTAINKNGSDDKGGRGKKRDEKKSNNESSVHLNDTDKLGDVEPKKTSLENTRNEKRNYNESSMGLNDTNDGETSKDGSEAQVEEKERFEEMRRKTKTSRKELRKKKKLSHIEDREKFDEEMKEWGDKTKSSVLNFQIISYLLGLVLFMHYLASFSKVIVLMLIEFRVKQNANVTFVVFIAIQGAFECILYSSFIPRVCRTAATTDRIFHETIFASHMSKEFLVQVNKDSESEILHRYDEIRLYIRAPESIMKRHNGDIHMNKEKTGLMLL